jgi:hypothetical protein
MDSIWWAASYQQEKKKSIITRKYTSQGHLAVTIVLGIEAVNVDLDRRHQNSMVELEDRDPQKKGVIMKTTKKRWGHRALPVGFAQLQFLKDSNYPMTSKNTTDHKNHNHGSQIIYKQFKY